MVLVVFGQLVVHSVKVGVIGLEARMLVVW